MKLKAYKTGKLFLPAHLSNNSLTILDTSLHSKENLSDQDNTNDETKSVPKINKRKVGINFEQGLNKEQKNFIMKIRRVFEKQPSCEIEKVGTEIILEEQNVDTGMESIIAFIRKCMNICWSMYRHVPPVHVDFPDVTENILFDTNIYKAYTKSGKYVHYIVWPAVYFHEGVAQGRTSLTRF